MVREDGTLIAEVTCAPGARLHFCWGLGSELLLCDLAPNDGDDHLEEASPSTTTTLQWGYPGPLRRRVIYDTLPRWQELRAKQAAQQQGASATAGTNGSSIGAGQQQQQRQRVSVDATKDLVEYSETISEVLQLAVSSSLSGGERGPDDEGEAAVLAAERVVWQLLHAFFVGGGRTAGSMTEELVSWLYHNSSLLCEGGFTAEEAKQQAASVIVPEDDPVYWSHLQRCVSMGWALDAAELLGRHTAWMRASQAGGQAGGAGEEPAVQAQVDVLDALVVLLRRMPRFHTPSTAGGLSAHQQRTATRQQQQRGTSIAGAAHDSMPEYLHYRSAWQGQCRQLLCEDGVWARCGAAHAATSAGCKGLLRVLAGDERALGGGAAGNWVELFVAQLLHLYPGLKPQVELRELLSRCLAAKPPDAGSSPLLSHLATLLPLAGDLDVQGVVRACSAIFGDWFMAHAADLLAGAPALAGGGEGRRVLDRQLPHAGGDQREFYSLEYASTLMPLATGWQVAIEYLAWCPAHGAGAASALLSKLPAASQGAAGSPLPGSVLHVCRRFALAGVAAGVCRSVGVAEWGARRVATSLGWLQQAHDDARAAVVVAPLVARIDEALRRGRLGGPDGMLHTLSCLEACLSDMDAPPGSTSAAAPPASAQGNALGGSGGGPPPRATLEFLLRYLRLCRAVAALEEGKSRQQQQQHQGSGTNAAAAAAAAGGGGGGGDVQLEPLCAAVRDRAMDVLRGGAVGGGAPVGLWPPLMFSLLPLLDGRPGLFSAADTQALAAGLQDSLIGAATRAGGSGYPVTTTMAAGGSALPPGAAPSGDGGSTTAAAAALDGVRLGLARNLARAHVLELQPTSGVYRI